MKGIVKGIVIGLIIIIIGAAILIAGLALSGWKIERSDFETRTFTAEGENTALNIEIGAGSVTTEFYDGDKVIIEYPVAKHFVSEARERDGRVFYSSKFKWYVFFGSHDVPDTLVKLPKNSAFEIDIEINAGSVTLADGDYSEVSVEINAGTFKANAIDCATLKCDLNAGTVNIAEVACNSFDCDLSAGTIKVGKVTGNATVIDVSAGTATLGFAGDKSEYGISAKVSAGSCNVSGQTGTTGKTINIDVSAGSVNLDFNV